MMSRQNVVFLSLVWVLLARRSLAAPVEEDSMNTMSCFGTRSTNIDHEYCKAAYADVFCDDWEQPCYTAEVSLECDSSCAQAGCVCGRGYHNCAGSTYPDELCESVHCSPPDDPAYVGSCLFFVSEESCESVIGCTWGGFDYTSATVVASEETTDSSNNALGIVIIFVLSLVGLFLLCGVIAGISMVCLAKKRATRNTDSTPNPAMKRDPADTDLEDQC